MRTRSHRVATRGAAVFAAAALASVVLAGCPEAFPIQTAARDFAVDVPNRIFNDPDLTDPGERGLGVESITFTFHLLDTAGEASTATVTLEQTAVDTTYDYTRSEVEISGELESISAVAGIYSATISAESGDDWSLTGWTSFANILKIKADYILNPTTPEDSTLRLLPCPRGWASPTLWVDSGAQAAGEGYTDRAADLVSRQVAVQINFAENPIGMVLDVYTRVVEEDLATLYNPDMTSSAYYLQDPWSAAWTYGEISSTGRSVAGTTYVLSRYNTAAPLDAVDPLADGHASILIDLSASTDEELTSKYLLVGIVMRYQSLSAPIQVLCVDIE